MQTGKLGTYIDLETTLSLVSKLLKGHSCLKLPPAKNFRYRIDVTTT